MDEVLQGLEGLNVRLEQVKSLEDSTFSVKRHYFSLMSYHDYLKMLGDEEAHRILTLVEKNKRERDSFVGRLVRGGVSRKKAEDTADYLISVKKCCR